MFGSNNYLGLASDPRVIEAACAAVQRYGVGIGGSSFLSGYSSLQRELEEATAHLKGTEDCIIFASGFCANVSWVSALIRATDAVVCDGEAHMSFREGVRMTGATLRKFRHNSVPDLEANMPEAPEGDKFIFVEGLYSMRGDVADIPRIYDVAKRHSAFLVIDDAHGTGTLGATGKGVTENIAHGDDLVIVGTYSKALGANGGFICGSKALIDCLRLLAPAYMFSTALSPASMGGALRAVRILLDEPERVPRLRANARALNHGLQRFGAVSDEISPIVFVRGDGKFDAISVAKQLEHKGCFVNAVSFPAVGRRDSGLRISVSSEHSGEDLQFLIDCLDEVLAAPNG
jgi:glycine C-acetyltransferase